MGIDLSTLNHAQIATLRKRLDARAEQLRDNALQTLRARITSMIRAEGFTVEEALGRTGGRTRRRRDAGKRVAPKYRNPENAAQTWSGRGQKPRWMSDLIAKRGSRFKSKDDFLIR
jgi:DNA-binding protein H-NS